MKMRQVIMKSKRTLINWLGLLGVVSFLSYAAAVIIAPFAYPGYDWMSQAVSDLNMVNAPSLSLWNQLSSLYSPAGLTCIMIVCVAINDKFNKTLRIGIYMWAIMCWVSAIGFGWFPLSESGRDGRAIQDTMHLIVTAAVVLLSITSLITIMIGGYRKKRFVSIASCAMIALGLMCVGPIGFAIAPPKYFGIFQRFSNLIAANGFTAALGIFLFMGKLDDKFRIKQELSAQEKAER